MSEQTKTTPHFKGESCRILADLMAVPAHVGSADYWKQTREIIEKEITSFFSKGAQDERDDHEAGRI